MLNLEDSEDDQEVERKAKVWARTLSTSIQHLELIYGGHTYGAFSNLAKMTQLAYLMLSSVPSVEVEGLESQLAAPSSLTNLDVLRCHFPSTIGMRGKVM